ncbi:hypothetical protein [Phascolarctobacterium faecium]|uniref:hypothetical protein n=1 Tax=Phascolarctobacterium faecium TaxID=33025 RepID=UPI003FF0097E
MKFDPETGAVLEKEIKYNIHERTDCKSKPPGFALFCSGKFFADCSRWKKNKRK